MEPSKPASAETSKPESPMWNKALRFPCEITADLPHPKFTFRQVMQLKPGDVLDFRWYQGKDVPMQVNGRLIAWAEFEVAEQKLALRVTELA